MKRQRTVPLLLAAALAGSSASGPPLGAQTVRLPLADFETLRQRATLEPDPAAPPAPWALEAAELEIRVGPDSARLTQVLDLLLLDPAPQSIPVRVSGALTGARLEPLGGRLVAGPAGAVLSTTGVGRQRVTVESIVAVGAQAEAARPTWSLSLANPGAAAVRGRLFAPPAVAEAELVGGVTWPEADGSWGFVADPRAPALAWTLRGRALGVAREERELRFSTVIATATTISRTRIRADSAVEVRVEQGELATLRLAIPSGFEVVRVTGPELGWKRDSGELVVAPFEPVRGVAAFQVTISAPPSTELASPVLDAVGARAQELFVRNGVAGDGLIELLDGGTSRAATASEVARIPTAVRDGAGRWLAVPDAASPPRWRAEWAEGTSVLAAQVERLLVEYTVGASGRAGLRLWAEVRNRGQERLAISLPPGFAWIAASRDDEPIAPALGAAGALEVPLAADEALQVVRLAGHLPAGWTGGAGRLDLPIPAFSAPVARVEVRALLPAGREYLLTEPSRAGPVSPPPRAVRAERLRAALSSNAIARQMSGSGLDVAPAADRLAPLPSGAIELTAAWSALTATPAPLAIDVRDEREDRPWF
jgi:hypothetical protein